MKLIDVDLRVGSTATDGTGSATAGPYFGRLYAVEWVDGTLVDGVDATLAVVNRQSGTDITLLTLTDANNDAFYYPRAQVHDNAGGGVTYDGVNEVYEMPLVDGVLKCSITSGGSAKTGGMIVYIYDES